MYVCHVFVLRIGGDFVVTLPEHTHVAEACTYSVYTSVPLTEFKLGSSLVIRPQRGEKWAGWEYYLCSQQCLL